jgi:hypothetical protein
MLPTPEKNKLNSKISHFFWQLAQTFYICNPKGRLAQLVQSTCLTSRGSLVRTQYLPPIPEEIPGFFYLSWFSASRHLVGRVKVRTKYLPLKKPSPNFGRAFSLDYVLAYTNRPSFFNLSAKLSCKL